MLGGFDTWLLSSVGGLETSVNGTDGGWRNVVARVSPAAVTRVKAAVYRKTTRFGDVDIDWTWADTQSFNMSFGAPIGVQVTVHTPTSLMGKDANGRPVELSLASLSEGSTILWTRSNSGLGGGHEQVTGLLSGPMEVEEESAVVSTVGSGRYHFSAQYS
jgi:hypothetical protein